MRELSSKQTLLAAIRANKQLVLHTEGPADTFILQKIFWFLLKEKQHLKHVRLMRLFRVFAFWQLPNTNRVPLPSRPNGMGCQRRRRRHQQADSILFSNLRCRYSAS